MLCEFQLKEKTDDQGHVYHRSSQLVALLHRRICGFYGYWLSDQRWVSGLRQGLIHRSRVCGVSSGYWSYDRRKLLGGTFCLDNPSSGYWLCIFVARRIFSYRKGHLFAEKISLTRSDPCFMHRWRHLFDVFLLQLGVYAIWCYWSLLMYLPAHFNRSPWMSRYRLGVQIA